VDIKIKNKHLENIVARSGTSKTHLRSMLTPIQRKARVLDGAVTTLI
jgi:hypothetical protein